MSINLQCFDAVGWMLKSHFNAHHYQGDNNPGFIWKMAVKKVCVCVFVVCENILT